MIILKKVGGRLPAGAVEKMNYGPPGKAVLCQVLLIIMKLNDEMYDVDGSNILPSQGSEILHHVTPVR